MRRTLYLILIVVILCACHPTPAPSPTDYPVPLVDATVLVTVIDQAGARMQGVTVTAYVGDSPKVKTTDANGRARFYLNYMAEYRVTVTPPDGYQCETCEKQCPANGGVVFTLVSDTEPTKTPTVPTTSTNVPTPTRTHTAAPTLPGPTATPWDDLPAWAIGILSWDAQQEAGVDWADAPKLWAYAREHDQIPTGNVHIATINGVEVKWVSCGNVVLAEANGNVYEVPFWAAAPTARPTATMTPEPTETPVPTPTYTASPIPTVLPQTATPTSEPAAYATVVPAIYKMFDYGTDYQSIMPELGPIGSVQWAPWSLINPAPGVYNWDYIDQRLESERGLTVTLSTGEIVPKPILLFVCAYTSDPGNPAYIDWTPEWLGESYTLTSGELSAVVPRYDDPAWREAYWDMVRALGARYNNDPQITAIVVATGLDSETTPTKDGAAAWETVLLDQQLPGVRYRFTQFVEATMPVYREAFPSKQLYINNAPGGMRMSTSEMAASYDPAIGLKHSGMWYDMDSHQGYGDFVGSWDHINAYSDTLSIWLESPFGLGDDQNRVWSLYAGLHYHPSAISVHPEYLSIDPYYIRWASAHCGVTIEDTPSVWTVLRDAEYPKVDWGSGGTSGHMGDWTFWLYRDGDAPTVTDTDDTLYGRQARSITNPVRFYSAPGFDMGRVELTVKCQGQTLTLEDPRYRWELTMPDNDRWITLDIDVATCTEFTLANAGLVHMVEAFRPDAQSVDRLFIINLAVDSNLSKYGVRMMDSFDEIPEGVAVEILFDQFNGPTREYTLTSGGTEIAERGNINSGDGNTVSEWARQAMAKWDANEVIVVLADHGDGTRGVCFDYPKGHDYLTPSEIEQVLGAVVTEHKDRIDLVWYDACLMQTVEMAELTSHYARYQGGYENLGWSLFDWEHYVTFDGTIEETAVKIANHYMDNLTGPRNVSVLDLSRIGPVLDLVSQLSQEDITEAIKTAQRMDNGSPFGQVPAGDTLYDLKHLSGKVGLTTYSIDDIVILNRYKSGTMATPGGGWVELKRGYGLSIHHRKVGDRIWSDYASAFDRFCDATGWCERPASMYEERLVGWPPDVPPMGEAE